MRYRRYYVNRNRDQSRTVVSTGPFIGLYVLLGKVIFLAFPLALTEWIHGTTAWTIVGPLEIVWLGLIWMIWSVVATER